MKGVEVRGNINWIIVGIFVAIITVPNQQVIGKEGDSSLQKYKWALQFGIQKDLALGSFEAGDISFKRQMNSKAALRFGLTIRYSYDDYSYSRRNEYTNDISIIYQRYVNPMKRAKFYWGTGPYLHYLYGIDERSRDGRYTKGVRNTWGVGILGLAGIEWFATSVISFHAEYRPRALYTWSGYKMEVLEPDEEPETIESTTNSFNLNISGSVLFGISVYF